MVPSRRHQLVRRLTGLALAIATIVSGCSSSEEADTTGNKRKKGANGTNPNGEFGDSTPGSTPCTGLQCQQKACSNGAETTVTGKVYAPSGTLPLYNAIVYVPNAEPEPLVKAATCDTCGVVTGQPIVTALTDATGTFTLKNVPVGKDIPLVIQIGKWRRQVKLPEVKECTTTELSEPELTRLPKKQSEGDIPRIALTTGGADNVGCMLPKIGLDPSEFGVATDGPSKSVHTYVSNGEGPSGATSADALWKDAAKLKQYDMVIFSCEGNESTNNKGNAAYTAVADYLKAGGRVFTTDFMYTWYKFSTDSGLASIGKIPGGAPVAGGPIKIDTSFPKGKALADWLDSAAGISGGNVAADVVYGNFTSVNAGKAQVWGSSPGGAAVPFPIPGGSASGPRVITTNVPVGAPAEQQCGRAVHIDAHANNSADKIGKSYPASCSSSLRQAESLLSFFFFDLAACIQNDAEAPKPPGVK